MKEHWEAIRREQERAQFEWLKAKMDREVYLATARAQQSDIAREANEGTVIDGVVVRKPQPRLT